MSRPFAIVVALACACTGEQPAASSPPADAERVSPPADVVEPAPAPAPRPEPPPKIAAEPPPAADATCDLTGTWQLKIITDESSCAALQDETIDLALAHSADGPRPALASAAKPAAAPATIGKLLAGLRAAPVNAPGLPCGVRLELRPPGSTHAELLLAREGDGLHGVGTIWTRKAGKPCSETFQAISERTAPVPEPWSKLTAAPAPTLAAPTPASPELAAAVGKLTARSLLGGVTKTKPSVKLAGSIVDYVAAVLEQPGAVKLYEVACTAASGPDARCVAVVGDPCAPGGFAGEDCEGMFLTVVVDARTGKLDRADSGRYPVESQADIEARLEMAP